MKTKRTYGPLCFIILFLISSVQAQSTSSCNLLSSSASNPYFSIVNQTLYKAYSSYLSQSTVNSVSIYDCGSLVSIVIIYRSQAGALYKAAANYLPLSRQLSVQSFGPIVQSRSSSTTGSGSGATVVIHEQNGIGITMQTPYNRDYILSGSNPSLTNPDKNVLKGNSTSDKTNTKPLSENVFGVQTIRPPSSTPR